MRKNKIKVLDFSILGHYQVHIELSSNIRAALKKYKQTENVNMDDDDEDTDALAIHVKNVSFSYIFLPHNARPGTIAHESWHVVRRMFEHVGADLEDEMVAYHIGYLVDQIVKMQ